MRYSPAFLLALSLFANAQEATVDRADYCDGISKFAERIMLDRQLGMPIDAQMSNIRLYFTTETEQLAAGALVEDAWGKKQASTTRRQQIQTNRFRDAAEEDCLDGEIFPF